MERTDFECIIDGNVWHYTRASNQVTRNGYPLKDVFIRFNFYKTFENYCRRYEHNQ